MKLQNSLYKIESRLTDVATLTYKVRILQDCFIYDAHFPTMPITPGVCIIQLVRELLEEATNKNLEIVGLKNVKFLSVMPPTSDCVEVVFTKIAVNETGYGAQAVVKGSKLTYAKLSMQTKIA